MADCKHEEFDTLIETRNGIPYQACLNCGRYFPLPCKHVFKLLETKRVTDNGRVQKIIYVKDCKHCGMMYNHYVTSD